MARLTALLDANALYSAGLRDLLLRNPQFKVTDYLRNLEHLGLHKTVSLLRPYNTVI